MRRKPCPSTLRTAANQANYSARQRFPFWKQFNKQQGIESDFDREAKRLLQQKGAEA